MSTKGLGNHSTSSYFVIRHYGSIPLIFSRLHLSSRIGYNALKEHLGYPNRRVYKLGNDKLFPPAVYWKQTGSSRKNTSTKIARPGHKRVAAKKRPNKKLPSRILLRNPAIIWVQIPRISDQDTSFTGTDFFSQPPPIKVTGE